MEVWQTDVGNAYLEAYTTEKVYVIAGGEFGDKEGHVFIEVWMRACNPDGTVILDADLPGEDPAFTCEGVSLPIYDGYYEYIAVYCDDLTIASMNPKAITEELEKKHNFKLK